MPNTFAAAIVLNMDTKHIVEALKQERTRISQAIAALEGSSASMNVNGTPHRVIRRRRMSAEARARIAAAQRRRWAAVKAGKKK